MKIRIVPAAAGLAAAAGIALTGASLASADTSTPAASTSAYSSSGPAAGEAPVAPNGNTDPSKPVGSDETLLTGDVAARVTAAAKAKEPTATIERVETDSDGVYEAHMVRTDGTHIIVQVDKTYAVTAVQEGGAGGGPGRPGGQGGAPSTSSGQASSSTAPSAA